MYVSLLRQELGAIYGLNRARETHCRAARSVFAHISEYNRAAEAERLLDTWENGYQVNFTNKL